MSVVRGYGDLGFVQYGDKGDKYFRLMRSFPFIWFDKEL